MEEQRKALEAQIKEKKLLQAKKQAEEREKVLDVLFLSASILKSMVHVTPAQDKQYDRKWVREANATEQHAVRSSNARTEEERRNLELIVKMQAQQVYTYINI
jgi:hypothetical protein